MDLETDYNGLDNEGLSLLKFNSDRLTIPKKVEYLLRKYVSIKKLNMVDSDKNIAIEKCLIFLDNLSPTYYSDCKWKPLSSKLLHAQTRKLNDNTFIYKNIINLLKEGTSKGSIIEVLSTITGAELFTKGKSSKAYKISETYIKPRLTTYLLTTDYLIQRRRAIFFKNLSKAANNNIGRNLINIYGRLTLPSEEKLLELGKQLCKKGKTTKKGKMLTMRNRHSDDYWTDSENRSYIEDNIELFSYLTTDGFIVPNIGSLSSGGRVVDSFTLMPSWIRNTILIDGEETVEIDYKCLHPNIAVYIYGGNKAYITHKIVSESLGIDIKTVKIEHLSFFNKQIWQLKESQLYDYYIKNEQFMVENLIRDKTINGYKETSMKMFKIETEIMSEVIKRLNVLGIYVLYVYDALLSKKSDRQTVKKIMNEVVLEKNIYTLAE